LIQYKKYNYKLDSSSSFIAPISHTMTFREKLTKILNSKDNYGKKPLDYITDEGVLNNIKQFIDQLENDSQKNSSKNGKQSVNSSSKSSSKNGKQPIVEEDIKYPQTTQTAESIEMNCLSKSSKVKVTNEPVPTAPNILSESEKFNNHPLVIAITNKNHKSVKLLLGNCPWVSGKCPKTGNTILHLAVLSNNVKIVKSIVDYIIKYSHLKFDPNTCNKNGETVLHLAYKSKNKYNITEILLKLESIESDIENLKHQSVISIATLNSDLKMLKMLINKNQD